MHTIRQATINDLPTIRYLWALYALGANYPADQAEDVDTFTRQLALGLTQPDPEVYVFLAETASQAIGFILYEVSRRAVGSPHRYGYCAYLYTLPDQRTHGVANDLVEVMVGHGLAHGVSDWELNTDPKDRWNAPLGHTPVSIRMRTTATHVLAAIDRRRERAAAHPQPNGHDTEAPLPAPVVADLEE